MTSPTLREDAKDGARRADRLGDGTAGVGDGLRVLVGDVVRVGQNNDIECHKLAASPFRHPDVIN